jgi:AGCS family alanine or glycine:cation symporter
MVGESKILDLLYKVDFFICTALGASVSLNAVIAISDSMFFSMAIANIIALYFLAPQVKIDLINYQKKYCSK